MKLIIERDKLLKPLQIVSGAVERRQTLPILSNVLLSLKEDELSITATDLEIELIGIAKLDQPAAESGEVTVPARKLLDICRSLPSNTKVELSFKESGGRRMLVRAGSSRFTLTTLPVNEFPNVEENQFGVAECALPQHQLKSLLEKTYFAMAQQDVRYFLNGVLLELNQGVIRVVATDGHRLAVAFLNNSGIQPGKDLQIIIPRKGVMELMRLLKDTDEIAQIAIGTNHICIKTDELVFTSKLIEGKFPNYNAVIPKNGDREVTINRDLFKQALARVSILSNETYRGVRINLSAGEIRLSTNNPEQEEAEEIISANYDYPDLEIGFNVNYFLDICNTVTSDDIKLTFSGADGGILAEEHGKDDVVYVVMPMRI
ncbi:MAG: DNA polymerase III subunit beta [Gammaproteobacteria bacterium]|jgi:DNA polymerase-3 subunit beta